MTVGVVTMLFFPYSAAGQNISPLEGGRFATDEEVLVLPLEKGQQVQIISAEHLAGQLRIVVQDKKEATFRYRRVLKTSSRTQAIDYARAIAITMENTTGGMRLWLQAPNPAPWSGDKNSGRVEGELILPRDCLLKIDAIYFDLDITGPLGGVDCPSSLGAFKLEEIRGKISMATSNQSITGRRLEGDITLSTTYAGIDLAEIKATTNPVVIRNEYGNIAIEGFSGALDIRNDFGKIRLEEIILESDRSRIRGSYSSIRLSIRSMEKAEISIRNNNEDIEIIVPERASAAYSLKVEGDGEINASGLDIVPNYVDYNRLDFKTGTGESKVRVTVSGNGDIFVKGNQAGTP